MPDAANLAGLIRNWTQIFLIYLIEQSRKSMSCL